jgi:ABC-type antimicrobial peptide transport system permease subunit
MKSSRKEFAIRMALGARPPQVLRLVMREGAVMTSVGAVLGFAGGGRALTVGVPMLLVSLAAIACYLPARRSTSLDPLVALREE